MRRKRNNPWCIAYRFKIVWHSVRRHLPSADNRSDDGISGICQQYRPYSRHKWMPEKHNIKITETVCFMIFTVYLYIHWYLEFNKFSVCVCLWSFEFFYMRFNVFYIYVLVYKCIFKQRDRDAKASKKNHSVLLSCIVGMKEKKITAWARQVSKLVQT